MSPPPVETEAVSPDVGSGNPKRIAASLGLLILVAGLLALSFVSTQPPPPPKPVPVALPPPAPPPPPPAPENQLPDLPEVQLKELPVHSIPEPAPSASDHKVSSEVANGASSVPLPSAPKQFSGKATATGATALLVGNVPVELFGVKAPMHDRCSASGANDCAASAQRALAAKIAGGGKISCQVPTPRAGMLVAFAICLDGEGTDLGGYLVSEGLALADTAQTYDYAGAESIARGAKRGLWAYR